MATVASSPSAQSENLAVAITSESSTTANPEASTRTSSASYLDNQHEGVLRDVLDELDRERSQRAELQARARILEEELQRQKQKNSTINNPTLTTREFLALQAERDGYLEIVHALTKDRPVFSQAKTQAKRQNEQKQLPLHVIRLLEIMPWDPRARQHLFGQETLYEWQIMGADKSWLSQLRYFPTIFKTLPIVVPQPGKTVGEAPTSSSPPKQCVLSNLQATIILNIDKGYPLPQDGGDWVWVGGWRIEKGAEVDKDGWSYSNDINLNNESSYYSEFRPPQTGTPNIVKRRRKWTRSRVMIDYPQASAATKEYLKLLSEKATLDVSVEKLSSQLVDTKMKLTTLEAEHLTLQEETSRRIATLERDAKDNQRVLQLLQDELPEGAECGSVVNLAMSKKDQVKELRSAVTAWVSNNVTRRQNVGSGDTVGTSTPDALSDDEDTIPVSRTRAISSDSTPGKASADVKQQMFESLKGKGSDFLEKIKQKGGEELERIKQKGGEELDKIKKQNLNASLPWASPSSSST